MAALINLKNPRPLLLNRQVCKQVEKAFELWETAVADVHAAYENGDLTCFELVRQYINRIERLDKAEPPLNAIIAINPNALDEAKALDEKLAQGAKPGGLFGVPVLLKDNCETKDMPTTAGSKSLEGWQTGRDAFLVKKLREAGAIIIAKTNLHEFAIWGKTVSSILGQSYNPYDYTRTPGGSSGGTGAAVAANFGLVGIGTDTVNSIRSPSSACSLFGIRPTVGLVSRAGIVPYSMTQDTAGPIARTMEDAVRVLDVISGYDEADPETEKSKDNMPKSYMQSLKAGGLGGKRLGVLKSFFGRGAECLPVNRVVCAALHLAAQAGAQFVMVDDEIDSTALVGEISVHLHEFKTHLNEYLQSFGGTAPMQSLTEIIESGLYTADIEENIKTANTLGVAAPDYKSRMAKRAALQKWLKALLDDKKLDALIYPHQQQLVCKAGDEQGKRNGALGSVTGFPAIAIPAGFSPPDENAPLGVPVGMEIIGRPFDECRLIEIAYGFEQAAGQRRPPFMPDNPSAVVLNRVFEGIM